MLATIRHRFVEIVGRLRPLLPLGILAAACALGAVILSSCGNEPAVAPEGALTLEGVPTIRVLLTPRSVPSATLAATGGYELLVDDRIVMTSEAALPPMTVRRDGRRWRLADVTVHGADVLLRPVAGGAVRYADRLCRGALRLAPAGQTGLRVINALDMESYLAGVLAKELYHEWLPETYAALAIAARSFALYHMRHPDGPRDYDVGSDQAWQVYGGLSAETETAWNAVRATHGVVLAWGPEGRERLIMAQYSACCGGRVNSADVIRKAERIGPLLGGQACDDCRGCPYYRWGPVRITTDRLRRALRTAYPGKETGPIRAIRCTERTDYGRAVWLDVVGRKLTVHIRAEDLRLALLRDGVPLHSMNCRIRLRDNGVEFYDGRGFGHGVGLCQWGAEGKAKQGWTAQQILQFYYPGARFMRAY